MVAAAVQNLCEAANALVQGHGTEEKLISAARQVASSTTQLLVACKVKADADSVAMKRLKVSCLTWFSDVQWTIYVINYFLPNLHEESLLKGKSKLFRLQFQMGNDRKFYYYYTTNPTIKV